MFYRKIFEKVNENLDKKDIIMLLWARQVWKTSIMKHFFEKIQEQKVWFNLDKISSCEIFSSSENVLNGISLKSA